MSSANSLGLYVPEALIAAPDPALRKLFEFLGEPWEPEVLDYHRRERALSIDAHAAARYWVNAIRSARAFADATRGRSRYCELRYRAPRR